MLKEEVSASGSNEICASGDGTWKTRGHTSRIGVCSVIGDVTGKVIDVAVLSSYCKGCEKWRGPKSGHSYEEWKLKHQPHCVKNHIGSSSKMEVDGMKEIFQRSVPQRNAKYIKYIGDGDTKTFPELQRTAPYSIEKLNVLATYKKRMGARLRKLKTMNRGKNYQTSTDKANSVAFSQRSSSPRLVEDETFDDSDIINNSMDYEDEQEPNSLRADKISRIQFSNKLEKHFLKIDTN
ncbi:uncharacterized protein TNCV_3773271 [Trichonephila clavipes]|nr:uncharacterized protein TNCV_3773271 [Trichonephila clavipes]